MKRWSLLPLVGIAALGIWLGSRNLLAPAPQHLTFQFTCDVRGRLVPCGCFSGQMGGLTRIATLVGGPEHRESVKVDIGDAIESAEDYHRIEHRYILSAFKRMGYDAANLGHREAQLTAQQLRELKEQASLPLLSANLLDASTAQPIFDTHLIVTRGKARIALIGAMSSQGLQDTLGEGLAVEPIDTALGRLLPQLRKKADCIVLLAFADEEEQRKLARNFYEVDVILGGKVAQPSQALQKENRTWLLSTTNQSRALGSLKADLTSPGTLANARGEVVLVHDRIPESGAINEFAQEYRAEIRRTKLEIDDPNRIQQNVVPGVKTAATYAGSASCVTCHASAAKTWHASAHAEAFHTLIRLGADADPDCISCHTVGFGTPGGYRREFGKDHLTNVGCESCHGPGSKHVAQRTSGGTVAAKMRPLSSGDCQKCHHGEFSRPFDWDKFWPTIQHGRESAGVRANLR